MIKKHISLNGDSMGSAPKSKASQAKLANAYRNIRIGRPAGKPSVSESKIVAAVRAVMKEDGML